MNIQAPIKIYIPELCMNVLYYDVLKLDGIRKNTAVKCI